MRLKIAARKSDLARLQAVRVAQALQGIAPDLQIEFQFKASLGDQNADQPLWQADSKGVFTQDFYDDLMAGRTDLVVHSWKDLPVAVRPGTVVAATLPRADARDVLLIPKAVANLTPERLKVLTSSPRRVDGASRFFKFALPWKVKHFEFAAVRGNVPTRLQKLMTGEGDILLMAKAALDRLLDPPTSEFAACAKQVRAVIAACRFQVLPLSIFPTAAAQGALAIEIKSDNELLKNLLNQINHNVTFHDVIIERNLLESYGGGCHQKIGMSVLTREFGQIVFVQGETQASRRLHVAELRREQNLWQAPKDSSALFPNLAERESLFERELIPEEKILPVLNRNRDWWVARESAIPSYLAPGQADLIWTAGVKTWMSLARRGFWVNGTADALGEREPPKLDLLVGRPVNWLKLTHWEAAAQADMPAVGTYKLIPCLNAGEVDFGKKTHFFWLSGSQFLWALQLDPGLATRGFHASGPGRTAEIVQQHLRGEAKFALFLNFAAALKTSKGADLP